MSILDPKAQEFLLKLAKEDPFHYDHKFDSWTGTFGRITHDQYNKDITWLLQKFRQESKCSTLSQAQVQRFVDFVQKGTPLKEFSEIAKTEEFIERVGRMRSWVSGFQESVAVADAIFNNVKGGAQLNEKEMKHALRIIINGDKVKANKKVLAVVSEWNALGQQARKGMLLRFFASKGWPVKIGQKLFSVGGKAVAVVGAVTVVSNAVQGAQGKSERFPELCGAEGAFANAGYYYMMGEEVETYIFPAIETVAADLPANILGVSNQGDGRRVSSRGGGYSIIYPTLPGRPGYRLDFDKDGRPIK